MKITVDKIHLEPCTVGGRVIVKYGNKVIELYRSLVYAEAEEKFEEVLLLIELSGFTDIDSLKKEIEK